MTQPKRPSPQDIRRYDMMKFVTLMVIALLAIALLIGFYW